MVCGGGNLYGIRRGGIIFGGLGLQGHPDGPSVIIFFEDSFTEEGTVSGKAVFEIWFKFSVSEARKKFDRTASEVQI